MSHSREPSHGKGTASSQGAAIRAEQERRRSKLTSGQNSPSTPASGSGSPSTQNKTLQPSKQQQENNQKQQEQEQQKEQQKPKSEAPATSTGKQSEIPRQATRDPSGRGLKIEKRIFKGGSKEKPEFRED